MAETKVSQTASRRTAGKVKSILVSQRMPTGTLSPYHRLAEKFGVKIDFRPFIKVEPVAAREFRRQKIDILAHSAVILTSRNAVDHFFRLCSELRIEAPADMKYFCISEQTANYLQKYIVVRRRKVFVGAKSISDLVVLIKKHKKEKYLFPCSDVGMGRIPDLLARHKINCVAAVMYRTVAADLDMRPHIGYDMIALFSPSGVASLLRNFPDFKQENIRIATFGKTTAQAARKAGLTLDVEAPLPNAPSMTGAIELYIRKANGEE